MKVRCINYYTFVGKGWSHQVVTKSFLGLITKRETVYVVGPYYGDILEVAETSKDKDGQVWYRFAEYAIANPDPKKGIPGGWHAADQFEIIEEKQNAECAKVEQPKKEEPKMIEVTFEKIKEIPISAN